MSIKGKVKTIPPYYKTLGNGSFEFGEEHRNPRQLVPLSALSTPTQSERQALDAMGPQSLLVTPYSQFIPALYLRYHQVSFRLDEANEMEFLRTVVRRAINAHLMNESVVEARQVQALHQRIPELAEVKRTRWGKHPLVRILSHYWIENSTAAQDILSQSLQQWCNFDTPVVIDPNTYGLVGAYSREDMLKAFSTYGMIGTSFSQRTYNGYLDFGAMLYRPANSQERYRPAALAVVTPENLQWQRLHWTLTGTLDTQRMSWLVDRELDNPKFPIGGLREFYRKMVEPWMLSIGANIWKVPVETIEELCFMPASLPVRNLLELRRHHDQLLTGFRTQLAARSPYGNLTSLDPVIAVVDPAVQEALQAAEALTVEAAEAAVELAEELRSVDWGDLVQAAPQEYAPFDHEEDEDEETDDDWEEDEQEDETAIEAPMPDLHSRRTPRRTSRRSEVLQDRQGPRSEEDAALQAARETQVPERSFDDWFSMAANLADEAE